MMSDLPVSEATRQAGLSFLERAAEQDARLGDPGLRAVLLGRDEPHTAARLLYWQTVTEGLAAPDAALERRLAVDILAIRNEATPEMLARARAPMLARAASWLRAEAETGESAAPGHLVVNAISHPFRGFYSIEALRFEHQRFDGGMNRDVTREVMVGCDAVTILPYDPYRDRVLLIEQLRPGPIRRGDGAPWMLEAVAGRIDAGESPEEAARREATEEAGISLGPLIALPGHYPAPAAMTEYIHPFIAIAELPDHVAGSFGLASEQEDIQTSVIAFDDLMAALDAGRLRNAPVMILVMQLARLRPGLRAERGLAMSFDTSGAGKPQP